MNALMLLVLPLLAAQPVSPPLQLPPTPVAVTECTSTQLSARTVSEEGAAGTILDTLQLVNTSNVTCTVQGYPTVLMFDSFGTLLSTNDVPGGGILARPPGSSPIVLAPGAASPFGLAWSDVPVGSETTCPAAAMLGITPPDGITALSVALMIAPCGGGTIDVGPLRAPGESVI